MNARKLKFFNSLKISVIILPLFFTACISLPKAEVENRNICDIFPNKVEWLQVCDGISYFTFNCEKLIYHVARIELEESDLKLLYFPDKCVVFKDGAFNSVNTKTFAKEKQCILAINACPFNGNLLSSKRELLGTHVINGTEYGRKISSYAALCFRKTSDGYQADIVKSQGFLEEKSFDYAFGGFFQILEDGHFIPFKRYRDSRCGAGLSADKKILYILVCEGEVPSVSEGLTFEECACIFNALGAFNALEFDGGASAELYLGSKSLLSYKQKRVQASSFGFAKIN